MVMILKKKKSKGRRLDMITDYNRLSGLHKVAILFSVLGESLAMSLIKGLSRTEVRKIRATIREMDSVSFTLKRRIMEEFYFVFFYNLTAI